MLTHTVATVILELAYLATGVTFCFIGKGLLEKGIWGKFDGEGQVSSTAFRITTSSPGLVFALAGMAIVLLAILRTSEETQRTTAPEQSDSVELAELAQTITTRRLAAADANRKDAQARFESARLVAQFDDNESASVYLAQAIVLDPSFLKAALEDESLASALDNTSLQALIEARLQLRHFVEAPQTMNHDSNEHRPVVPMMRMLDAQYIVTGRASEDVTETLNEISVAVKQGNISPKTVAMLQGAIPRSPRQLANFLEGPHGSAILSDAAIAEDLLRSTEEQLEKARTGEINEN